MQTVKNQSKDKKNQEKQVTKVEKTTQEHEQNDQEENEEGGNKDPQTLSEGERMGLSKKQLRKLQKRLNVKKKKQDTLLKQEEAKKIAALEQAKKPKQANKQNKKKGKKQESQIDEEYRKTFLSQKILLEANTKLPAQNQDNILITSALPYVNNVPHLGNIIGCVLSADVYSRFKKLQGSNVLYICGTDEYGTATQVKAMEQKKTPKQVCDHYYKIHEQVYRWFDIGFDYFGRTTTDWHTKITQQIFLNILKQNRTLQQQMNQCYCPNCDFWLADRLIVGICPFCQFNDARGDQCDKCQKTFYSPTQLKEYFCFNCKKTPQVRPTTHFFVNLPVIQQQLQKWINQVSKKGDWSQNSIAITKAWTNMGLKPKCITRDLKWGVPVPIQQFKKKVFYVWFDAPIGYISITANLLQENYKKWWINENVKLYQFMGKDNVPFHTVIFPSSLIASRQGWTLLHHISTTQYLNYENGKFSKRNGTGVFGTHAIQLEKQISSQVWRYYLLVNRPEKSDSQFSWKDFSDKNNNELVANLGNLVHRALQYIYNYQNKVIPSLDEAAWTEADEQFIVQIEGRYHKYRDLLSKVQIKEALKFSMQTSSRGNKYLQDSQFWLQKNQKTGRTRLVLNVISNFIRFQSFLIEPYLPSTSAKINFLLGLEQRTIHDAKLGHVLNQGVFKQVFLGLASKSKGIKQPIPLFNLFTQGQVSTWRQQFKGKQITQ